MNTQQPGGKMKLSNNRTTAIMTGSGALVSMVGATLVGFAPAASAATLANPTCNASKSVTAVNAELGAWNAKTLATYKASKPYKALHATTLLKAKAYAKAKGKAKVAAKKAYLAALAKENLAVAAFRKANSYTSYTGTNKPAAVSASARAGLWNWGTYTTRVLVKNGSVLQVCTYVDESAAANDLGTLATAEDKATSADLYQGASKGMDQAIPGQLPTLWYATLVKPAHTQVAIEANVTTCATQSYDVTTTACPKGGLSDPTTHLTGATYTVAGYKGSLHAALVSAKASKTIG
jgi:hypothetical protein